MSIKAQLHDGTTLEFPDGTDPAVIQKTVLQVMGKAPSASSSIKGSTLGGVFMGLRDPIDAGAQMLVRALPDSVVRAGNSLNNQLADWGVPGIAKLNGPDASNLSGLVTGKQSQASSPVDRMVSDANADYDASRKLAGRDGLDLARIAGNIANPVNRIVPMGGAASTAGVALRAGAQGAISGALQPVTDSDNFASTKSGQIIAGGVGGAVGGAIADKLVQGVGNLFASMRAKPGFPSLLGGSGGGMPAEAQASALLTKAAADQGIDLSTIPKAILDDVRGNVTSALKRGKTPDAATLARVAEGKAVLGADSGLMTGQASRDPQLFARELDLRGIQGAGKPIADRLALQNQRFIDALGKKGAAGAPDAYDAGSSAITSLQALDKQLSADVTAAYGKFRLHGGATLDVPLQPLAQKFGEVIDTFGRENIPGAVMSRLESYGLMGGKQTKVFDLLEADKLIKTINANIDPMKGPQTAALGSLRSGLSQSIDLAETQTQGASGPAADLLREAISKAKARFSLHDAVPALEAASKDRGAQEAFVRQYVTGNSASIDSVASMVKLLSPDALDAVRRNVLASIMESAAPGAVRGSDAAKFSQAGYRRALDAIGDRKLATIFGSDGLAQLRQIGRVSEWAQAQPAGSAVNNSNTGAAVMNLVQGLSGKGNPLSQKIMSMPGANILRNTLSTAADESAVRGSLLGTQAPKSAQLLPEEVDALRRYLPSAGGLLGGTAASSIR